MIKWEVNLLKTILEMEYEISIYKLHERNLNDLCKLVSWKVLSTTKYEKLLVNCINF